MSTAEGENHSGNVSRKSSISSSTGSSFEKIDKGESIESNEVSDESREEEQQGEAGVDVASGMLNNEIEDLLDAPIKPEQEQFYTHEDRANAIRYLIMFSSAMFTLPLLTMFSMYHYVFIDYYHLPPDQAMLYAAICGISVVVAIVAIFVWTAYKEEVEAEARLKKTS